MHSSHPASRLHAAFRPHAVPWAGALIVIASATAAEPGLAQSPDAGAAHAPDPGLITEAARGLSLRGIGPALMGGRIADIAVHPDAPSTWYVAVGSGGVWKTENAGTTWTPIFDGQQSYSIGDVAIDPSDPDVVWVGTGENVSGRHVAWGDGVYRSRDGGRSWEHMGLGASEHIGKVLVDPRDGRIVFVAAEGPLWSAGGERGLYRSEDAGATWQSVLAVDESTGVTDVEFDPVDPDVMYAATYERRRTVWSLLAGGRGSGIHKSTDGGRTWREVTTGLPRGDMGKIGLAVSGADRNVVYATIEAGPGERGFYRSTDRGESWERRNGYISGGTGPHYYQEIEASPHDPDLVYQMDVFVHVTRDGGATFSELGTGREKHSDNHAFWIDPADGRHILAGTDAGLYETFDEGDSWRHFPNMPVSQFYKLALDNSSPFYNILGGAQDLGTLHGPSRTMNLEGVRNRDWYAPLGADGYAAAFDPFRSDIAFIQSQQGNLQRVNLVSHELIGIRPLPAPGDPPERWNWDSPVIASPHAEGRIYYASQRVWRSDDRGDSWTSISDDLTRGTGRYEMPVAGRVRSVDALWGNTAMSWYGTITAISESPVAQGVVYAGTDDGLVQATTDGGDAWQAAAALPGLAERGFVNDVKASQHAAATVFVAADNHKEGDYAPYLYASDDHGASWRSIAGDLPAGAIVWSIEQDHENADLLFAGTERGVHFTPNGGANWIPLGAGVPPIAFRDLEIQRRDSDLVGATFGRGFYVLDDYSPLRETAGGALAADAALLPVRDAWWYVPNTPLQAPGQPTLGSTSFVAPNPDFGAAFTYWLADSPASLRASRREAEAAARERGEDIAFPGYEALAAEALEGAPRVALLVRDAAGTPVRRVTGPAARGLHRVTWDLRRPAPNPVDLSPPGFTPPWAGAPQGPLAPPGDYTVEMALITEGGAERVGEPQPFAVKPVPNHPDGTDFVAATAFAAETAELLRRARGAAAEIGRARERLRHMRAALDETPAAGDELYARLEDFEAELAGVAERLQGSPVAGRLSEPSAPSIMGRIGQVAGGHWGTRQEPTATMRSSLAIARAGFDEVAAELEALLEGTLAGLEADLEAAGAPWTPGRGVG